MPFRCARGAFSRNEEPTLDELLADRAVRLMMASDRVEEAEIREIAAALRARIRDRGRLPAGAQGPHSPTD